MNEVQATSLSHSRSPLTVPVQETRATQNPPSSPAKSEFSEKPAEALNFEHASQNEQHIDVLVREDLTELEIIDFSEEAQGQQNDDNASGGNQNQGGQQDSEQYNQENDTFALDDDARIAESTESVEEGFAQAVLGENARFDRLAKDDENTSSSAFSIESETAEPQSEPLQAEAIWISSAPPVALAVHSRVRSNPAWTEEKGGEKTSISFAKAPPLVLKRPKMTFIDLVVRLTTRTLRIVVLLTFVVSFIMIMAALNHSFTPSPHAIRSALHGGPPSGHHAHDINRKALSQQSRTHRELNADPNGK